MAGLSVGSGLFAIVAAYFLYSGFSTPTTITVEGNDIANLQLMHIQMLNISIGIGAAVVSAILATGAAIVGAIKDVSVS